MNLISTLRKIIALTEKEVKTFIDSLGGKVSQKDLQDFTDRKRLTIIEIDELMYDLRKHGISNLKKPTVSNKGTPQAKIRQIVKTFTNMNGDEFLVRIVHKGDMYGANFDIAHDKEDPLVEFYDTAYQHTTYGQFVSRYYFSTLIKELHNIGLDLLGHVPKWKIDAPTMQKIISWLKQEK